MPVLPLEIHMARLPFLAVVLAAVVAGCADLDTGTPGVPPVDALPAPLSVEEAEAKLASAVTGLPSRFGLSVNIDKDGATLLSMDGSFDNDTRVSYLEVKGDAGVLGGGAGFGGEEAAALFQEGFAMYATADGALYLLNGTAFVFSAEGPDSGFIPSPTESPFGQFLQPGEFTEDFSGDNVTIRSVTPVLHRGQPAYRLEVATTDEDGVVNATLILFANPVRLAHASFLAPEDQEDPAAAALAGAQVTADFFYDGEVQAIPEGARRALGLAYKAGEPTPDEDENGTTTTWTFLHDGGVPLAEVEVHAKGMGADSQPDVSKAPTLWTMGLAEGEKAEGGVTVTFTDADGDGTVSQGDTLAIHVAADAEEPVLLLYDAKTGTYVVPGPGAGLLVAALALVVLALRRK